MLLISKFKSTFSEKLPTPTFNCYHVQTRLKKSFRDLSSAVYAHQENHLVVESMTLHISSSSFMVMFFFQTKSLFNMHLFYLACQALLLGQHAHSHQNIYDKYLLLLCNCLEVYHKQFQNNSFDRIVLRAIKTKNSFIYIVSY